MSEQTERVRTVCKFVQVKFSFDTSVTGHHRWGSDDPYNVLWDRVGYAGPSNARTGSVLQSRSI